VEVRGLLLVGPDEGAGAASFLGGLFFGRLLSRLFLSRLFFGGLFFGGLFFGRSIFFGRSVFFGLPAVVVATASGQHECTRGCCRDELLAPSCGVHVVVLLWTTESRGGCVTM